MTIMSTETEKTSKRPTHRIYAVYRKNKEDKGYSTEIGAAWQHKKGNGFRLKLDYLPLNGAEIVAFGIDDQTQGQEGGAQ